MIIQKQWRFVCEHSIKVREQIDTWIFTLKW